MAKYIETLALAEEKKELIGLKVELAQKLTKQGRGKTHYIDLVRKRGTWMLLLMQR